MKKFLERLFCKHDYKMIEGTCHLYKVGVSKMAEFKCQKCGKEIYSDIFAKSVNRAN